MFGKHLLKSYLICRAKKITFDVIELIPTWINSKFDDKNRVARKIERELIPKLLSESSDENIEKAKQIVGFLKKANKFDGFLSIEYIYEKILADFLWNGCPDEKLEKVRKIISFIKEHLFIENKNPFLRFYVTGR